MTVFHTVKLLDITVAVRWNINVIQDETCESAAQKFVCYVRVICLPFFHTRESLTVFHTVKLLDITVAVRWNINVIQNETKLSA